MPRQRPTPVSLSDQVRQVVAARGLSASALAIAAGISPSIATRFINRERDITSSSLDALALTLDLHLVEGRGGMRANPPRRSSR